MTKQILVAVVLVLTACSAPVEHGGDKLTADGGTDAPTGRTCMTDTLCESGLIWCAEGQTQVDACPAGGVLLCTSGPHLQVVGYHGAAVDCAAIGMERAP